MAKKTIKAWAVIADGQPTVRVGDIYETVEQARSGAASDINIDAMRGRPIVARRIIPCTITIHTKARKANA